MHTTHQAYLTDFQKDHVLITQLSNAHKTIAKQDHVLTNLKIDNKRLQEILNQKDAHIKSLENMKANEASEMNKFYLERLQEGEFEKEYETPRIQNENRMIRDQIKMLLSEAKERSHEVTRLKKLIHMYELQKEEYEHKFTMMKNKEIKMESEIEQIGEN